MKLSWIFVLFMVQLLFWSVRSKNVSIIRDISCRICSETSPPNYECDLEVTEFADKIQDECHLCGIWEKWEKKGNNEWILNKNGKKRMCITSDVHQGCTYWYPAHAPDEAHEICRCDTDQCNDGAEMTDIGGLGHPSKFPPQKRNGKVTFAVLGAGLTVVGSAFLRGVALFGALSALLFY